MNRRTAALLAAPAAVFALAACGGGTSASPSTDQVRQVLASALASADPGPAPSMSPSPPAPAKLTAGDTFTVKNAAGNDTATITVSTPTFTQAHHGPVVYFTVSVQALAGGTGISPTWANFYLRGVDGTHNDGAQFLDLDLHYLASSHLAPGEPSKGVIAFDSSGQHGTVVYTGNSDRSVAEWTF